MPTKKDVVDKILGDAYFQEFLAACPMSRKVQKAIAKGEDLPEQARPGKVIERLSPEEREVLKTVTAEDFNHQMLFAKAAGIPDKKTT